MKDNCFASVRPKNPTLTRAAIATFAVILICSIPNVQQVQGDEAAESVLRFAVESLKAIRSYEVLVKYFEAKSSQDPSIQVAEGSRELHQVFRVWIDSEKEKGLVITDSVNTTQTEAKSESYTRKRVDYFDGGVHHWRRVDFNVDPRNTREKSTFEEFAKYYPSVFGIPFGLISGGSASPEKALEAFCLKVRSDCKVQTLASGASIIRWTSKEPSKNSGSVMFSEDSGMPIQYTTSRLDESKRSLGVVKTCRFVERDGIFLPASASYSYSNTVVSPSKVRDSEKVVRSIWDRVGTYELEWIQVNPTELMMPDAEEILAQWPQSFDRYKSPK